MWGWTCLHNIKLITSAHRVKSLHLDYKNNPGTAFSSPLPESIHSFSDIRLISFPIKATLPIYEPVDYFMFNTIHKFPDMWYIMSHFPITREKVIFKIPYTGDETYEYECLLKLLKEYDINYIESEYNDTRNPPNNYIK